MFNVWKDNFQDALSTLQKFMSDPLLQEKCSQFSQMLIQTYKKQGKVFSCGNGGSHCDAMHFAEELTGRYRKDRKPLGALALGDGPHTTCVGNDYGFEHIFSRQFEGLARPGDLLLTLSTSGNSPNILAVLKTAKKMGVPSVALLGRSGGEAKNLADLSIVVPAETSDRIQEVHIKILHIAIEAVERDLFPENYR